MEEGDWNDEINNGSASPDKVEARDWEHSRTNTYKNNSYPRSRGFDDRQDNYGRGRSQNNYRNNRTENAYSNRGKGARNDRRGVREQDGQRERTFGRSQNDAADPTQESTVVSVPSGKVGLIIGKGGSRIRELQDESGARIDVERDSDGSGKTTVEISGSAEAQSRAKQLINKIISDNNRGSRSFGGRSASNDYSESGSTFSGRGSDMSRGFRRSQQGYSTEPSIIHVPSSIVGKIIGRGGSRIRELQDESGAQINIQRDSDSYGETAVEISGSQEAQSTAKELINELIDDSEDRGSRSFRGNSNNDC